MCSKYDRSSNVNFFHNIPSNIVISAYVTVGGYNVITADWSRVASNIVYPLPAYLTVQVGAVIAKLLENFVNLAVIDPFDIHVIGHSLGAHVSGACGAAFSLGKIGRVTGEQTNEDDVCNSSDPESHPEERLGGSLVFLKIF